MDKLYKFLHKKLDININTVLKKKKKEMNAVFKEEKLEFKEDTPFSFYQQEIIYHGILNKRALEKAYLDGYAKMYEFFDTLDYKEKQRMMNYEIDLVKPELLQFTHNDKPIYVPFFEEKLNAIYDHEMVLFALKQYRRIFTEYKDLIHMDFYGLETYASSFSSIHSGYGTNAFYVLYDEQTHRVFIIKDGTMVDYIFVRIDDNDTFVALSKAIIEDDKKQMVDILLKNNTINEKVYKKCIKIVEKG